MKNNNPAKQTSQAPSEKTSKIDNFGRQRPHSVIPKDYKKFRLGEISPFKEAPKEQLIAVIEDASPADRAFLNGIVHFDNNFEAVYPSQSTLGNRWGYTTRTMRRSARKLHKYGIVRKYKHESQESCYYMVNKHLRDYSVREKLKHLIPAFKFFHLSWLLPIAMTSWSPPSMVYEAGSSGRVKHALREAPISPLHYTGKRAAYSLISHRKGEPYIPQRNAFCGDWNNCIIEMILQDKNNNERYGKKKRVNDWYEINQHVTLSKSPKEHGTYTTKVQGVEVECDVNKPLSWKAFESLLGSSLRSKSYAGHDGAAMPAERPLVENSAPPKTGPQKMPLSTLFSKITGAQGRGGCPAESPPIAEASVLSGGDLRKKVAGGSSKKPLGHLSLRLHSGQALSSYCEGETVLPDHIRQQDVHDIIPHYICELRNLKLTLAGAVELTCFPKEALQYADAALNRASPSDPFKYFCKIASSYCKENDLRPDYSRRESLIGDLNIQPDAPRLLSATEVRRIKDEKRTREVEKTLMGSQSEKDAVHWANELKTNSQLKANLAKLGLGDEFNPFKEDDNGKR